MNELKLREALIDLLDWSGQIPFTLDGGSIDANEARVKLNALKALENKSIAPDGWKMVPIQPTISMLCEGSSPNGFDENGEIKDYSLREAYLAMLAAAPEPPK